MYLSLYLFVYHESVWEELKDNNAKKRKDKEAKESKEEDEEKKNELNRNMREPNL